MNAIKTFSRRMNTPQFWVLSCIAIVIFTSTALLKNNSLQNAAHFKNIRNDLIEKNSAAAFAKYFATLPPQESGRDEKDAQTTHPFIVISGAVVGIGW